MHIQWKEDDSICRVYFQEHRGTDDRQSVEKIILDNRGEIDRSYLHH